MSQIKEYLAGSVKFHVPYECKYLKPFQNFMNS